MSWRREWAKLLGLGRRGESARELEEEIRTHLAMEARENLESGMPDEQAQQAAFRRFGNRTLAQENSADVWRWTGAETVLQDVQYGLRQLRRNPGFTAVAVLTFALGIGTTTAIFSVVNSVLLRPLPFKTPAALVEMFETEEAPGTFPLSGADYLDWERGTRTLEATSLYSWPSAMSAGGPGGPDSAAVVNAEADFFDVLGVSALRGRTFARGEDAAGKNHVAVLSYGFWQSHFGGSGDVLGRTILLNGEKYVVAGVMPQWFNFRVATDVWIPFDRSPTGVGPRGMHSWNALGRLKPGVSLKQAQAELLAVSKRLEKQYPDSNDKVHAVLVPLKETLTGDSQTSLLVLLGAVLLVLLVASVNVANLQLARASTRHREMALRSSLGAGRFRLVRQMLTESLLLALGGAAVGVLGAWWGVHLLASAKSLLIPLANPVEIDGTVMLFATVVSVIAGLLFGLAPALQNSEKGLNQELRAGAQSVISTSGSRRRLRDALVVAEIAMTVALLVGAGLLLRSFANLRKSDIGVNPEHVLTAFINLPETRYGTLAKRRQFFDGLVKRVQATPGVQYAAVSREIPLEGGSNGYIQVDGKTDRALAGQLVGWNYITPEYFRTFGIPVLEGRIFGRDDADRAAATAERLFALFKAAPGGGLKIPPELSFAAVISRTTARTFWRNADPVGKSFRLNGVKVTVIGVVGDVKENGIRAKDMPQAYFPLTFSLAAEGNGHLTVKTLTAPRAALGGIRIQLRALDDGLALFDPQTMDEVIAGNTRDVSLQTFLLGAFAGLALLLAAVGLYGVMSYLVTRRTREIGIRMALGAERRSVLKLILWEGSKLTLAGMLFGTLAAFALTRSMSSLLYGVTSYDPATFVVVIALLGVVALTAYYIPARRATKVDPIVALRYE